MSEAARTGPEVTLIDQSSGLGRARSALPQVLIPLIAAVIFVLDVFTPAEVPIGVLYTILVLIASRFYEARGISTVAAVCTILVFVADPLTRLILSAPGSPTVQLINDFLCIATIGLTCFLIVQGQAASAALRRSEEEWKEIFEHTPTMYFMVNPAGTVMSVNHFGAAQLGYAVDELIGQSVLKVFPEPDRELARRNVAVCLENLGQSHTWELRKIRNDGSVLWVRENAKAVRRSRNDLIVLIACEDITERKRGEQRLAAQYAATRVLAESDTIAAAVPQLLQTIGEALEWEWGGLWCADCEGGRLRCVDIWRTLSVSTAEFDAVSREMTFSPGQGRPGQVWQSAEPVWMHDVTKALSFLRSSAAARAGLHGAVAFPILLGGEAMGVVEFFSRASRERDEEQLATLSAIGSQIGQFIKRKRAEERLQESERRFRALIENGSDVVLLVDAQNTVLYASPSLTRVLGYEREELIGRTLFDLVHPDQVQEAMGGLAGLVEQSHKLLKGREYLLRHKDGSWRWLEAVAANLLDEPGVHAVVINLRDVTERKQAEEALRESEHRFRDYAETASDWFWETGPDHRFTQFAPSLTAHGVDLRRLLGKTRWEIAADPGEEPDKWRDHRAVLEARQPFRGLTYQVTREDGSVIYISVSGKPVFDNQGRFLGYRGVSSDITALVRAEEAEKALQDARAELAHIARVTTLGELTASIGHEINQPLAAVVTDASAGLRWLNGRSPNLAEARQVFARIMNSASRAADVIRRIRTLARKSPIRMDQLDINEVIREVIALTRSEMDGRRIMLRTELADDLPLTQGDRVQLQQVILNLIMNAIEAMSGGNVRELLVSSELDELRNVTVSVRDSGPGLDPESMDHIFDAFYTTKSGGMGMGLAISRSIVEKHGGRIRASPDTSRGTKFQFTLPAGPVDAEPAPEAGLPSVQ